MTMDTIFAVCITGILSGWVWNLKHQMRDAHGALPLGQSVVPSPSAAAVHHVSSPPPPVAPAPTEDPNCPSGRHYRRGDGVQTFVIEESEASPT